MGKIGILAWTMGLVLDIMTSTVSVDRGTIKSVLMGRLLEPYKAHDANNHDVNCGRGEAQSVSIGK